MTELNHEAKDDGYFYIDMESYLKAFRSSSFSMYENWITSSVDVDWDRTEANMQKFKLVNNEVQEVVIGFEMYGAR